MFVKENGYYKIEDFEKLGVGTAYTTLEIAKDTRVYKTNEIERNKIKKILEIEDKKIVFACQTHSTNIAVIKDTDEIKDLYRDTDGFITNRKDIVLFTQYADCLPIYAYDQKNKVIGMCHAGWKGAFDGIQVKLIEAMVEEFNSNTEDILIGLGIGISTENYQVGEDFFENYYKKYGKKVNREVFSIRNNRYHYDNIKFNKLCLEGVGIKKENIITSSKCAYIDEFNSFRRDKEKSGRNGGFIYFK